MTKITTQEKKYVLKVSGKRSKHLRGTLDSFIRYFGYTLDIGYSHNRKINKSPKTMRSFVTNLQNSYTIKEGCCYDRTFVDLESKEELSKLDPLTIQDLD